MEHRDILPRRGVKLILGCMFSGKTAALLRLADVYSIANVKVVLIRRKLLSRAGIDSESKIASRCKLTHKVDCVCVDDILTVKNEYDVFLVDEGQFMPNLVEFCKRVYIEWKKLVVVAALNGSWEQKPFTEDRVGRLLPLATDIKLLKAVCVRCTANAYYSHNLKGSCPEEDIGSEQYQALCIDCLHEAQRRK